MKITKIILTISILVLGFINLNSKVLNEETATKEFEKANEYYQKGDYNDAIVTYENLTELGFESAELYYNLGNSYYRIGKYSYAILNYERAKRISPEDEDIENNLQIANLKIVDKIEPIPVPYLIELIKDVTSNWTSGGWGWIAILSIWFSLFMAIVFLVSMTPFVRKAVFVFGAVALIFSIFSLTNSFNKLSDENIKNTAIIMVPSVYVKSSPEEKGTDLFILHEGTKITILDAVSGWQKIKLLNGEVGWIEQKYSELI